jgi:SPOR domain
VLAQDQLEAAIAEMRVRFTAISRQIADQLDALARTAARSPKATHSAILSAAADIGAMQKRLCAEANRLPIGPEQRYALMQTLLQTQHDSLLHLSILVREQALAARGLIGPAPTTATRASPNSYMPTSAHDGMTGVQSYGDIGRALASIGAPSRPIRGPQPAYSVREGLPEIASTAWPSYGVGAPMEPAARYSRRPVSPHRRGKGASARPRRRAFALVKGAISRSLGLTLTAGVGLLIAYATFPQATPSDNEVKRLELPSSSIGPATPLPAPRNNTSASRTPPPDAPGGPTSVPDRAVPEPSAMPSASYAPAPSGPREDPDRAVPEPSPRGAPDRGTTVPTAGPSASRMPAPQIITLDTPLPGALPAAPADTITIAAVNPSAPAPSAGIPHPQMALAPMRAPGPPTENTVPEQFVPVLFTHKDQVTAARTFADLQREYPTVLRRRHSEVQSVDVNSNGTWHRLVVLPAGSRQQATHVCEQLMAAGYDRCWVKVY